MGRRSVARRHALPISALGLRINFVRLAAMQPPGPSAVEVWAGAGKIIVAKGEGLKEIAAGSRRSHGGETYRNRLLMPIAQHTLGFLGMASLVADDIFQFNGKAFVAEF